MFFLFLQKVWIILFTLCSNGVELTEFEELGNFLMQIYSYLCIEWMVYTDQKLNFVTLLLDRCWVRCKAPTETQGYGSAGLWSTLHTSGIVVDKCTEFLW